MQLFTGSSGYSYEQWKGPFYPEDLPAARMLAYYAARLSAVEINNTFYRMPKSAVMEKWRSEVPGHFRFAIKASQRITHKARLLNTEETLGYLWGSLGHLGPCLGAVLFQLPPNFKQDVERLARFLAVLPPQLPVAFEFRHASWFDGEVFELLRAHGAALCTSDTDETETPALISTADWGYLRLRRAGYGAAEVAAWAERLRAQAWKRAYVFFKHEDDGAAPRLAEQLAAHFR